MMRFGTTCGGVAAVGLCVILSLMALVPFSQAQRFVPTDQSFAPMCITSRTVNPTLNNPTVVCGNTCNFLDAGTSGTCVIQCPPDYGIMTTNTANDLCFIPPISAANYQAPLLANCAANPGLTAVVRNPATGTSWNPVANPAFATITRAAGTQPVVSLWVVCKRAASMRTGGATTLNVAATDFRVSAGDQPLIGISVSITATRAPGMIVAGLLQLDPTNGVCVGDACITPAVCEPCPGFIAHCPAV